MPKATYKEIKTLLKDEGWVHVRTSDVHETFKKIGRVGIISLPIRDASDQGNIYKKIYNDITKGTKFERGIQGGPVMQTQITTRFSTKATPAVKIEMQNSTPKPSFSAGALHGAGKSKIGEHVEQWKPSPEYPDYEVSRDSYVRRVYRGLSGGVKTKLEHPIPVQTSVTSMGGRELKDDLL